MFACVSYLGQHTLTQMSFTLESAQSCNFLLTHKKILTWPRCFQEIIYSKGLFGHHLSFISFLPNWSLQSIGVDSCSGSVFLLCTSCNKFTSHPGKITSSNPTARSKEEVKWSQWIINVKNQVIKQEVQCNFIFSPFLKLYSYIVKTVEKIYIQRLIVVNSRKWDYKWFLLIISFLVFSQKTRYTCAFCMIRKIAWQKLSLKSTYLA